MGHLTKMSFARNDVSKLTYRNTISRTCHLKTDADFPTVKSVPNREIVHSHPWSHSMGSWCETFATLSFIFRDISWRINGNKIIKILEYSFLLVNLFEIAIDNAICGLRTKIVGNY